MSRPTPPAYKTRNWPSYNAALKRRGSLTVWFDPAMTWAGTPTGRRGRQPDYGDAAIQTCLTMKVLFGMALRQTSRFVESLLRLIGLDWSVPDFSTLSHPLKNLKVNIPYRGSDGHIIRAGLNKNRPSHQYFITLAKNYISPRQKVPERMSKFPEVAPKTPKPVSNIRVI